MFQQLANRPLAIALIGLTWALICLPNLGVPSLWEVDEGHNTNAAQTMLESGNYIVPTFNYELRDDKPALLYWLQVFAFQWVGVNEWAARLPSALAALLSLLLIYELGRKLFNPVVGLLASLILCTSIGFCVAAHFANPDALLTLFVLATFYCFWKDYRDPGRLQFIGVGAAMGLGVLAKGPVAIVLPMAIIALFLSWQRDLRHFLNPKQWRAVVSFLLLAAPWYVWVAVETKGQWLVRFWTRHNQGRFFAAMENHGGPPYYYLLILIVGFGFWSIFLGLTCYYNLRDNRSMEADPRNQPWPAPWLGDSVRLLLCWFLVVFLLFSLSATKLPNYILPLYPAAALLMARALEAWYTGKVETQWWHPVSLSLLLQGIVGVALVVGITLASGMGPIDLLRERSLPALKNCMAIGMIPITGAVVAGWFYRRNRREEVLATLGLSSILFVAVLAGWAPPIISTYRAPRTLVQLLPEDQLRREVRIGTYHYFQPSLVFYCGRRVDQLNSSASLETFIRGPLPSYLFVLASEWETAPAELKEQTRMIGKHRDLYLRSEVMVLANRAAW